MSMTSTNLTSFSCICPNGFSGNFTVKNIKLKERELQTLLQIDASISI
jgi:hypothetical protein